MGCALGARISGTYPCTLIILSAFSAPFCPRCLSLAAYFSDQRAPVLRMHSEKLLVPHIQFVNDGVFEVFVVSLQIFFAHLLRVEYMYFRLPVVYMPGKRGDKIRTERSFLLHLFAMLSYKLSIAHLADNKKHVLQNKGDGATRLISPRQRHFHKLMCRHIKTAAPSPVHRRWGCIQMLIILQVLDITGAGRAQSCRKTC